MTGYGYGYGGMGSMMNWMFGSGHGGTAGSGYGGMGSGYGWMMGAGIVWMGIWLLLAIAGVTVLIIVLVRLSRGTDHRAHGLAHTAGTSLLILDERYARGEIDHDEYLHRRENLQ